MGHEGASGQDSAAPSAAGMLRRRAIFFALVAVTMAATLWVAASALSPGGWSLADILLLLCLAITLPWTVIGFWNAAIGFCIMRFARDPVASVTPFVTLARDSDPIVASTAILSCIRNESVARVVQKLQPLIDGLIASDSAGQFHVYVLSDTSDPDCAAAEDADFSTLAARLQGKIGFTYRRRTINTGYKAGNIADFCERFGRDHDFALTLDADSFMSAEAMLRLVRIMQANPKLGILQSLVVGLPSRSAFARIFQFGMRLGMRSYTTGSAWWQGDCGPYWGHNALLRLAPFMAHCELPALPDGVQLLSHDQVEAVLMRRAGYEVRVLTREDQSFEENPPTLNEFVRRDLRWCQGNMQYWHLLRLPGLLPVSRYQLAFAILMFIGSPAWISLLILGTLTLAFADKPTDVIRPDSGIVLFVMLLVMWFAPKIATMIDVLTRPDARRAFGGAPRFLVSIVCEMVFFVLLVPIQWCGHTIFFGRALFGNNVGWGGQTRDGHAVPWRAAARQFWLPTALGVGCFILLAFTHPGAIPYAFFLAGGPAFSIPLAVLTASPAFARMLMRFGIGRLPEETAPLPAFAELAPPAREQTAPANAA